MRASPAAPAACAPTLRCGSARRALPMVVLCACMCIVFVCANVCAAQRVLVLTSAETHQFVQALLFSFRHIKPPEETKGNEAAVSAGSDKQQDKDKK